MAQAPDAEQRIATGQSADDARSAAHRQFGNVGVVKDVTRDMWGWRWIDEIATDVRVSVRALAKTPRFTIVGIVTLGLSIVTMAVVLSTVDRAFWRRLPLPDAGSGLL